MPNGIGQMPWPIVHVGEKVAGHQAFRLQFRSFYTRSRARAISFRILATQSTEN